MQPTDAALLSHQDARALVLQGIEDRIAPLRTFHVGKRLAELALFVGLWAAGAGLTLAVRYGMEPGWLRLALYAPGILLSAVAINAFVLLLHEGMHHTLFPCPFYNRWVSVLLGLPVLMSFTAYQVMHLRHHTYLGDPRDPDDYENYTKRPHLLWLMHCTRLLCGAFLYILFIPVLALRHGSWPQRRRVVAEYALLAVVAVVLARIVPGGALLLAWFLPAVLVGYMTNLRGFTQHGVAVAADPFLASRTMKPHPVVAFCLLYENYHLEHHLFPEVPSHHLPELHALVWPRLPRAVAGSSYLGFLGRFLRAAARGDRSPIGVTGPEESSTVAQ
jgi:fatty acid desaturase